MATTAKRTASRLQVGFGLISVSVLIAAVGYVVAVLSTEIVAVRIVILVLFAAFIAALWGAAVQNGRLERQTRDRLRAEHPGALVERVRLWSLPNGPVDRDIPMHFIVADASEITFEEVDQTVLLRIPVADVGYLDLVTAQHDRAKDKAVTLIYGDEQHTVQFFTLTFASNDRLRDRVRTAIGWTAQSTP
ncbi:MAG: hypothetical protein ABI566_10025 [Pseudolysinimonas sp.]